MLFYLAKEMAFRLRLDIPDDGILVQNKEGKRPLNYDDCMHFCLADCGHFCYIYKDTCCLCQHRLALCMICGECTGRKRPK